MVYCHTLDAVKVALEGGMDVVVWGFTSMTVLSQLTAMCPVKYRFWQAAFLCCLTPASGSYLPAIIHGLQTAAKALGATEIVDLKALVDKIDREEMVAILRQGIQDLVGQPDKWHTRGNTPSGVECPSMQAGSSNTLTSTSRSNRSRSRAG